MKLIHLEYFLAAARSKSFAAAARSVSLAQPAFSLHIRALEEDIGVQLFTRSNKGVCLTNSGKNLVPHAEAILKHIKQAREDVLSKKDDLVGEVSISISPSISSIMLGDLFKEVQTRYPHIDLKITDVPRDTAGTLVEAGQLDFGLIVAASDLSNVHVQPAISQELYLLGKSFKDSRKSGHVNFCDLSKYPLTLGSRETHLRKDLENIAISENRILKIKYEQDSLDARRSIILSGLAYTIVPYGTFSKEIIDHQLNAKKIINPTINRVLSFCWSKNLQLSKAGLSVKRLIFEMMDNYITKELIKGEIIR